MCVVMLSDGYSLCLWVYKSIPVRIDEVMLSDGYSLCLRVHKNIPMKVRECLVRRCCPPVFMGI